MSVVLFLELDSGVGIEEILIYVCLTVIAGVDRGSLGEVVFWTVVSVRVSFCMA